MVARAGVALDFEMIDGGDLGVHQDKKTRIWVCIGITMSDHGDFFVAEKANLTRFTCTMW
jgi:hypothetical protein